MPTIIPLAFAALAWAGPPAGAGPSPPPAAPSPVSPADVVAALETAVADAIARAEPSVVAISREKTENDETLAIRGRSPRQPANLDRQLPGVNLFEAATGEALSFDFGSGVVVGDKGEILTAFHVVRGARALHVRATGRQAFDAEIIAADPRSDLAVIAPKEVPGLPAPKLAPVALGDAGKLRKGSFLIALGNPFNAALDGKASASWGILSNVARRLEPTPDQAARGEMQLRNYPTLLQLDAKLNLGMSGGAVINLKGELVGLTTAAANASGFDAQAGYAIPMDALGRKVVETLRQGKEYEYGFLGISLDIQQGTNRVMSANPGTPASNGGVQVDDEIVAVGDIPVADADGLVVAINSIPAGAPVRLKIVRRGEPIERGVELAKLRVREPVIATNRPAAWRGLRVDYTSMLPNATHAPELFEAMSREGVVVSEVESGSAAEQAGLKPGQLVSRVEGRPVRNPREFARAVEGRSGPVRLETDQGPVSVSDR
jgi:S1-C subfamily serine protease